MALTVERSIEVRGERPSAEATTLQANLRLLKGSLAMQVGGEVRKATTGVAGSVMLGVSSHTYDAALATTYTSPPMTFRRGSFPMRGASGALPTQAHIGKLVRVDDEDTVSSTAIGANDLSVKLLSIEGSDFWVEL